MWLKIIIDANIGMENSSSFGGVLGVTSSRIEVIIIIISTIIK